MQLIPTTTDSSGAYGGLLSMGGASEAGLENFANAMQDALGAVQGNDHSSVSRALADEGLVHGPYSRVTDGVTYTLEEVCFSRTELEDLRKQLLKAGAPSEALGDFDILAGQPDGATLAQVLASLRITGKPANLGDEDVKNITAFLNQIDPSGGLAERTVAMLREGRGAEALAGMLAAFRELDADTTINISQDDVALLGRALGLNKDARAKIAALFGDADSLELNADQLSALLAPATDQLGRLAEMQARLDEAANATVNRVVSAARERMRKEKEAEARESRQVQRSFARIRETVRAESDATIGETLEQRDDMRRVDLSRRHRGQDARTDDVRARMDDARAQADETRNDIGNALRHGTERDPGEDARISAALARNAEGRDLPSAIRNVLSDMRDGFQRNGGDGANAGSGEAKDPWSALLSKVDAKSAARNLDKAANGMLGSAFAALHSLTAPDAANATPLQQGITPYMSQQAAQQVQNGLLSALQNGGTRLDLQLHPAELGAITITLATSQSGELSASVRADRPETVQALNQQLDVIRMNLEQQGIKIDKLEVQLQQRNDDRQDSLWQGMQQHNAWQDQGARREELARLRNLASLNIGRGSGNSGLAQSVQDMVETAGIATRLHVVA